MNLLFRALFSVFFLFFHLSVKGQSACPEAQKFGGRILDQTAEEYTVYLQRAGEEKIDSIRTQNGAFSFCLPLNPAPYYTLTLKESPRLAYHFVTDFSRETQIEIQSISQRKIQTQGVPFFDKWQAGRQNVKALFRQFLLERRTYRSNAEWAPEQSRYDSLFLQTFSSFFKENSLLGLSVLYAQFNQFEMSEPSWPTVKTLYDLIDLLKEPLASEPLTQALKKQLSRRLYARKGAVIQDFSLTSLYGNVIKTQDYRGKYLLLDFWGSWCQPCLVKNEELRANYEELQKNDVEILTVMMDYAQKPFDELLMQAALENDPAYPWPQGVLFQDEGAQKLIDHYRAYILPRTLLFDPEGKVIAVDLKTAEELFQALR